MMDSIENGATIRVGFQRYYDESDLSKVSFRIPTYSLKINKKTILACYCAGSENNFDYTEVVKKITEIMKKKKVDKYIIYSGERLEEFSHKWVSCDVDYIGNKLEKNLRDKFKELIGKPAINNFQGIEQD
jgi:hypothetical protein